MQLKTVLALALAAVASSMPTTLEARTNSTITAYKTGRATSYLTGGVASACGDWPNDGQMKAAAAFAEAESGHCFQWMTVKNLEKDITVDVQLVEKCSKCNEGAVVIDLTPAAFAALGGDINAGGFTAEWSYK